MGARKETPERGPDSRSGFFMDCFAPGFCESRSLNRRSPKQDSTTRLSLLFRVRDWTDEGAWREFVERYTPRVFGWCRERGLQEADAADATQQVLLKLVGELRRFDYQPARGKFRAWLRTVTRNVVHDLARQWPTEGRGDVAGQLHSLAAPQPGPADRLYEALEEAWRQELLQQAEGLVQPRVRPGNWEAWRLCCREGLEAAEVARRLKMDVAEVYVAKSRVLKLLRAEVERMIGEADQDQPPDREPAP